VDITYTKAGKVWFAKRGNLSASGKTKPIAKRELLETEMFSRIIKKK
jgi:ABC-type cobalamin transport system ATPase subunit